jgi:hypothetical protein
MEKVENGGMDNVCSIALVVWIVICFVGWTLQSALVRRIKFSHHDKWTTLGEPMESFQFIKACITPSIANPFGGRPAIRRKQYCALFHLTKYLFRGDKELDADKNILKLRKQNLYLLSVAVVFFVTLFVITVTCSKCG